jgi:hypothetical protein
MRSLNLPTSRSACGRRSKRRCANISYVKDAVAQNRSAREGDQIAYIDLDSPEVQRLKSVALPLIMHLSEDQKREVKSLAHVMGLDGVAAAF